MKELLQKAVEEIIQTTAYPNSPNSFLGTNTGNVAVHLQTVVRLCQILPKQSLMQVLDEVLKESGEKGHIKQLVIQ